MFQEPPDNEEVYDITKQLMEGLTAIVLVSILILIAVAFYLLAGPNHYIGY